MRLNETCALCGTRAKLARSHIVPRFAVKWLKDSSATGYLRGANVNRRAQELPRVELLCTSCELVFSKSEGKFASRIFYPYVEGDESAFEYEEWLLRMATSLAWRCLAVAENEAIEVPDYVRRSSDKAKRHFAGYLQGTRTDPGPYSHHLFFTGKTQFVGNEPPERARTYLLRACDSTIVELNDWRSVIAYTKLPMMLFATYIVPLRGKGWHGTRIAKSGVIGRNQSMDNPFAWFLARRPNEVLGDSEMSPRQKRIIERDLLRNPERALSSRSFDDLAR